MRMTAFFLPAADWPPAARIRSRSGRFSPPTARVPTRRNVRRETKSSMMVPRRPGEPPASAGGWFARSMIEHELFAVEQRPQHVFQPLLLVRLVVQVAERLVLLGIRRQP